MTEQAHTLKAGDLVRLKSGGPQMIISHGIMQGGWACRWFDYAQHLHGGNFNDDVLVLCEATT